MTDTEARMRLVEMIMARDDISNGDALAMLRVVIEKPGLQITGQPATTWKPGSGIALTRAVDPLSGVSLGPSD